MHRTPHEATHVQVTGDRLQLQGTGSRHAAAAAATAAVVARNSPASSVESTPASFFSCGWTGIVGRGMLASRDRGAPAEMVDKARITSDLPHLSSVMDGIADERGEPVPHAS